MSNIEQQTTEINTQVMDPDQAEWIPFEDSKLKLTQEALQRMLRLLEQDELALKEKDQA